jgi:hypothetical protein
VRTFSSFAFVLCALASHARAQSFNIDCGIQPAYSPVPDATYGAAAGQTGIWNSVLIAFPPPQLVDLAGNPTSATIWWGGSGAYQNNSALMAGPHAALMDDWVEFDVQSPISPIVVSGLQNGAYDVFTYSMELGLLLGDTTSIIGAQFVTGFPWGGDLEQGISYARHRIDVTNGSFTLSVDAPFAAVGLIAWNGMQIVKLDGAHDSICEGTSATCPCGNAGAVGHGCASSFDPNGALLGAQGVASVAADSLVLGATGVSNSVVAFFQGTTAVRGGAGVAFGDGLRCAGGTTVRIAAVLASANQASYPSPGDVAISVRGALPSNGVERLYQAWYRNSASFCTSAAFNLSNAVRVRWMP